MKTELYPETAIVTLTIADKTYDTLLNNIVRGKIPPGSKISEPLLSKELGVSRGPLREALGRLESTKLIKRTANVGARVVSVSTHHLLEIFYIREALESLAAKLAAENMSYKEVTKLERLLEQHQEQVDKDQSYFQKEGDMDFHFQIIQGSKNSHLIDTYCNSLYHVIRLYRYQFGMVSKRVARAHVEHKQIVDAIYQRDGELAAFLMARHISESRKNVEAMLDDQ